MNEGLIPKRYAKALYLLASEKGDAATVYKQTALLVANMAAQPGIANAVENPFLPTDDKVNLLATAADIKQGLLVDFFRLVINNGRQNMIYDMALAYCKMYRDANGIAQVEVTTAALLPDASLNKIKDSVKSCIDAKEVEYSVKVNPELIGGFTVKVDSKLLDASIRSELTDLRFKLLSK